MSRSITETFKKINIELSGEAFYSILISLAILDLFIGYKIYSTNKILNNKDNLIYQKSEISNKNQKLKSNFNFYASSKGSKYYFSNCKSSIKQENKIYFDSEDEAKNAGYSLSKSCN